MAVAVLLLRSPGYLSHEGKQTMKFHVLLVGIEHLMSGICFHGVEAIQFVRSGPSTVLAVSNNPFSAYWPNRAHLNSTEAEDGFEVKPTSDGEIRWYAQVLAKEMQDVNARSYTRHLYVRPGRKAEHNEPEVLPDAVVTSMRRAYGEDADVKIARMRWNGDHWYLQNERGCSYLGIEPDGYIHS